MNNVMKNSQTIITALLKRKEGRSVRPTLSLLAEDVIEKKGRKGIPQSLYKMLASLFSWMGRALSLR